MLYFTKTVFYGKHLKKYYVYYVYSMFSHEEQEKIITKFLDVIEVKTIIKDKVSMCKKCKFNQQNMSLYKLNIPDNIATNICKYNYEECEAYKTLKELKENVCDCSMNQFEDVVEAVEDKLNIEEYEPTKLNTQIYYYVKLNPFPTYEKTLRVLKRLLKDEDTFYNKEFYNDIKILYETSFKFDEKIKRFYSKQRNRRIYEYDKTVDKKNNTKIKFVNHLGREMYKVESVIYIILTHIDNNEKVSKLKNKLYSTDTHKWSNKRIAEAHFEDQFSFERFMDARYPYLPTVEYKKRNPIKKDTNYLNNIDDFLT